jgi:predicted butyrate kinase (DUF1464 family)
MSRVLGIDPGTISFDVCGRDGDRVVVDRTFPTAAVSADPAALVAELRAAGPVDLVVGPSGYGLPWTAAAELRPDELELLLLADAGDGPRGTIVAGMGRLLLALKESGLPVCFAPGVVHLSTVPRHRKVNRIDMGTADKLCAAALAVWDQARRLGVPCAETSFVQVEMGGAFTAVLAVERGAIVDGSGGTCGALGLRALGAMDGELAYLLRGFPKDTLATGGMAWIAGRPECSAEELVAAAPDDERAAVALEAFFEDVAKRVAGHVSVLREDPREIVLSGRLSRVAGVAGELTRRLETIAPVRLAEGCAEVASEAAQGAALIGQGLVALRDQGPGEGCGGDRAESRPGSRDQRPAAPGHALERALVEAMRLRDACGSVLDHLYVAGAEDLRRRYRQSRRAQAPASKGGSS